MLCTAACVNAIVMNPRQRQRVHKARPAPSNADDAAVFDAKLRRDLASYEAARVISRLEQGDSARRAPLISAQKNALLQRAPSAILAICGVEQLVARRAHNPEVAGSSPVPATSRVVAHSSPRQTHERRVLLEGASFALYAGISRGGPGRAVAASLGVLTTWSPGLPRWPSGWAESLSGSLAGQGAGLRLGRSRWSGHYPRGRARWGGSDPLRTTDRGLWLRRAPAQRRKPNARPPFLAACTRSKRPQSGRRQRPALGPS